jgi:hypothetical protein
MRIECDSYAVQNDRQGRQNAANSWDQTFSSFRQQLTNRSNKMMSNRTKQATSEDIREGVAEGFVRVALNHPYHGDETISERHTVRGQGVAH